MLSILSCQLLETSCTDRSQALYFIFRMDSWRARAYHTAVLERSSYPEVTLEACSLPQV